MKTHDFLQPFETRPGIRSSVDTTAKPAHVLAGGIGTYTISHIPYLYHNQLVPKSEVSPVFTVSQASSNERNAMEENSISNCSSYAASGFTLWDESVEKKELTSKKSAGDRTNIRGNNKRIETFCYIHIYINIFYIHKGRNDVFSYGSYGLNI